MVAALGDRDAQVPEQDGRLIAEPIPDRLDDALRSAAVRSADRLAAASLEVSTGVLRLAAQAAPGHVELTVLARQVDTQPENTVDETLGGLIDSAAETPQREQKTALILAAGDPDAAAQTTAAIETVVPEWPAAARTAAAGTVGVLVSDAVAGSTVRDAEVTVSAMPNDGLQVTVVHRGNHDLPPEMVRALDLGATAWRAELWPESRRVVCEFQRADDIVSVAARDTTGAAVDDPVVNSEVLSLNPHRQSVMDARRLVGDLLGSNAAPHDALAARNLAEVLAKHVVSNGYRNTVLTARTSRSGLLTLEFEHEATGARWGRSIDQPEKRPRPS